MLWKALKGAFAPIYGTQESRLFRACRVRIKNSCSEKTVVSEMIKTQYYNPL